MAQTSAAEGRAYAESPGRYRTKADAYLVIRTGHTPKDAAEQFAADRPDFAGDIIVIGFAATKPAIGIDRKVPKEYKFTVQNGQAQRRKTKL